MKDLTQLPTADDCLDVLDGYYLLDNNHLFFVNQEGTFQICDFIFGQSFPYMIDGKKYLAVVYKNCMDMFDRHCLDENFFTITQFSLINPQYLIDLSIRGWQCLYDISGRTSLGFRFVHLFLLLRYRELNSGYRDVRLRYGDGVLFEKKTGAGRQDGKDHRLW